MKNFRLRIQLITATSAILNVLILLIGDAIKPHAYTTTDWVVAALMTAIAVPVIVDGFLASHYLSIIVKLQKLDERTLSALQDASVFRLRWLALRADRAMGILDAFIQQTLTKAKDYPALLESKEFQRAVYGYKYEKANRMIVQARLAAERTAEDEARRQNRQQNKVESLLSEGRSLGISTEKMRSVNPTELRDLVEQTKEKKVLRDRALLLGCSTYVEQLLAMDNHSGAKVFLIRADAAVVISRSFGVEPAVRELIAYGNLTAVEELLKKKKDEVEFAALIERTQDQIRKLPEPHRPALQKRLDALRATVYPSRDFQKVLHELETALKDSKV